MKFLTKVEEEVMLNLWNLGEAYINELLELYPDPKPNYNTISSFVRILEKKGFVDHKVSGKFHIYFAVVSREAYRQCLLNLVIRNYFNNDIKGLCDYLHSDYNEYNEKYSELLLKLKATIGDDNFVKKLQNVDNENKSKVKIISNKKDKKKHKNNEIIIENSKLLLKENKNKKSKQKK